MAVLKFEQGRRALNGFGAETAWLRFCEFWLFTNLEGKGM